MKTWVDLYRAHGSMRASEGKEASEDIRELLRSITRTHPGVLDARALSLWTYATAGNKLRHWRLGEKNDPGLSVRVPSLTEASLEVQLLQNSRSFHLHMLTVMLFGRTRDEHPWCVAVHLPDDRESQQSPDGDRQGSGACGHAALHCHAGRTLDHEPKLRVPLPRLAPADILAWVLSQVVPDFEPAPWLVVNDAMKKAENLSS
jgi:hypothetical protein